MQDKKYELFAMKSEQRDREKEVRGWVRNDKMECERARRYSVCVVEKCTHRHTHIGQTEMQIKIAACAVVDGK